MSDLFTTVGATGIVSGLGVFEFAGGDLVDDDLQHLLTLSLFTWRRAADDDVLPEGMGRQGWFGDADFGSRLWLLYRAKVTTATLARAKAYAIEALGWLVTEGIVSRVDAEVTRGARGIEIEIVTQRPTEPERRARFAYLWS